MGTQNMCIDHVCTQVECVHIYTCTSLSACVSIVHEAVACFFRTLTLPGRTWHAADEEALRPTFS